MTEREELRKLAEAATPGPWSTAAFQLVIDVARRIDVGMCGHRDDAAFIAAANPAAVLGLLDQLDAAEAKLAAVWELHSPARWYDEFCDDPSCEQEHVEINVADLYHARPSWLACECCPGGDLSETHKPAPWPCPTIRALDEGFDHE